MKALLLLFVTFSFVPLALSSRRLPSSSDVAAVVVDVQGKELKLGEPYYAISEGPIHIEGLCLHDLKNETVKNGTSGCPHDVVQCSIFDQPIVGVPIIFSNSSSGANLTANAGGNSTTDAFVMEETSYTIKFPVKESSCAKDIVWGLVRGNDSYSEIVTTDPSAGAAEFQLKKDGDGYLISYCIMIPLPRVPICYSVGFIQDGFYSRLGVGIGLEPVQFSFATKPSRVQKHATS